ncbi:MAG: hypothetical protein HZB51_32000 [Chloroflexi bacterium]|nr:hypothetical protein [Chloroflexota bacterium]
MTHRQQACPSQTNRLGSRAFSSGVMASFENEKPALFDAVRAIGYTPCADASCTRFGHCLGCVQHHGAVLSYANPEGTKNARLVLVAESSE